jgi:hypothetical protein
VKNEEALRIRDLLRLLREFDDALRLRALPSPALAGEGALARKDAGRSAAARHDPFFTPF